MLALHFRFKDQSLGFLFLEPIFALRLSVFIGSKRDDFRLFSFTFCQVFPQMAKGNPPPVNRC